MTTTVHRRPARPLRVVTTADVDVPELPRKCTVCRQRHDDPIIGQLCLPCARVAVANWSRAMGPTVRGMTPEYRALLGIADEDPRFAILE